MPSIHCRLTTHLKLVLLLITVLFNISICSAQLQYRLDTSIIPESYDIRIKPYLLDEDASKQFTFDGEVNITLHSNQPNVRIITLHKDYIEIKNAALYESATQKLIQHFRVEDLAYENETDKLHVHLKESLIHNRKYVLYFNYSGQIRNGMAGVFQANYLDASGETKLIALTQAQRIDARTIVPCWDEPAFKAKFRMQISRPKEYISVFNTRLVDTKIDGHDSNRYLDIFEWTPVMSTYLLAFMMSQYVTRGDGDLTILTRPEYYNYTEFAYNVAKKTLDAYARYTALPYKDLGNTIMQLAGSPKFPHNGMENWGLVLYRDNVLIQEPDYSDGWKNKQYTITILVHETAHMWFGNSVTFAWWSYFWLNEAFARYFQFYLAHKIYPEYELDQQFTVNQLQMIFERDALNTSLPLSTPEHLVQSPSQIASMFSSIAYAKGASIIRMFRNLMGDESFDLAIHEYLMEFHLKNTVPSDLFKYLKIHWPKKQLVDLDQFFSDWTEQVGFPVLNVEVSDDGKEIILEQERFLLSEDDGSDDNLMYTIPLTYTTNLEMNFNNLTPKEYFSSNIKILRLETPIEWIIFNIQQSNYYRVFYDPGTLRYIYDALRAPLHSGIHVLNRAQLIDDLFNFARVGMMDYGNVFKFLEYLVDELDYAPWQATFNSLSRIAQRLTVQQQINFGKFINEITAMVFRKLDFQSDDDTVLDVYNRNNIVYWTCKYRNSHCNEAAQKMLLKSRRTNQKITIDFRKTVYCSAVRFGDFSNYVIIDEWYKNETRRSEKEILLRSMGCTQHAMEFHYARILSGEIPQDYTRLALKPLYAENPENVAPMIYAITTTYDRLANVLGSFSSLADVISDLCNYVTTEEELYTLRKFTEDHGAEFGSAVTTLEKALKNAESNLEWAEQNLRGLLLYLEIRSNAPLKGFSVMIMALSFGCIQLFV